MCSESNIKKRSTIAILGATGSIGTQTLDVIRRYPDLFSVKLLTANSSRDKLFDLVREFRPSCAYLAEECAIPADLAFCSWYFGPQGLTRAIRDTKCDMSLCAIVGIAGLDAVMASLESCQRVLLANKEALVTGGAMVTRLADELGKPLLPVDSEHSAIFQALRGTDGNPVRCLHLTCSGGALRDIPLEKLKDASVADVLRHPTWTMGKKITVDCATMVNKGLEVMEACHLFRVPESRVNVVLHPESVVHSMIEYEDGTVSAILGRPDMRSAISYAMGYPARLPFGGERLDFSRMSALHFSSPDPVRYPALSLAREAFRTGGCAPVVFNGANEYAVDRFLKGLLSFTGITNLIDATLSRFPRRGVDSIEDVHDIDRSARALAHEIDLSGGDHLA